MNLYTYGHNSPIYYSDPSGHGAILSALTAYLLQKDNASSMSGDFSNATCNGGGNTATTAVNQTASVQTQRFVSQYTPSVYAQMVQMQMAQDLYNQSRVILGPVLLEEEKLKPLGMPIEGVELSKSWVYQTAIPIH